jgi:hypothetical protein
VFLLVGCLNTAQVLPFISYTDRDILPNNTVRALFIARDGALWIGTDNGLVRKFNNESKAYFKEDGLSQNNIWAVSQDPSGKIWVGSYGNGLSTYKNNQFQVYSSNAALPNLEITKLFIYSNFLYVGTSDGLSIINLSDESEIKSIDPNPDQGELFIVQDFIEIDDVIYVVSYDSGIYKVNTLNDSIKLEKIWEGEQLYAIHKEKDILYLSGKEHFFTITKSDFYNIASLDIIKPQGTSILWDYQKAGKYLFAAGWGVYSNDGGIYELTDDGMKLRNEAFGIESTQITSLLYTPDFKLLYVGTLDHGFYEVRLDQNVQFFPTSHDRVLDYASNEIVFATLYNDALSIDGVLVHASQFKQWQVDFVKQHSNNLPKYKDHFYELDYSTRTDKIVFYSVRYRNDSFWVNTSIGIYRMDTVGNLKAYLPIHTLEFNFSKGDQLVEPNFFHGTRIYESVDPLKYTYYDQTSSDQYPRYVVGSLQQGDKTYLTSIFNGLYVLENGVFSSYLKNNIWTQKRLRFITALGKDQLAVSNDDGDVFVISDHKKFSATPVTRNPDHGKTVTFLTSYKETLIIGTPKGVVLYDQGREIFLDGEQGINRKIFNGYVEESILYLASDGGSYQVRLPEILQQSISIDNIGLKSIKVSGLDLDVNHHKNLKLEHDQNSIQLHIQTNRHPYPQKLRYSYRLNENKKWIPMDNSTLSLSYLNTGNYELFVQVIDNSTGYRFDQQVLSFYIATPFYKSYWFIILCFISVLGLFLIYFGLNRKRAHIKSIAQKAITKRIEEVKLEALLSQMNPHFIFNSLNSIQYFISNNENDKAMKYLGTFSELLRANLNSTTRQFLTMDEEIDYLKKYIALENARFNDRVQVNFTVDPLLSGTKTNVPAMILQPFIENVFVHAFPARVTAPKLKISFKRINALYYRCTIKDNGIGSASLNKNKRHISKGTHLVVERLSFLGYDPSTALNVSYNSTGTIIKLQLEC